MLLYKIIHACDYCHARQLVTIYIGDIVLEMQHFTWVAIKKLMIERLKMYSTYVQSIIKYELSTWT